MTIIKIHRKNWVISKETATKIVLVLAENPVKVWRSAAGINQRAAAAQLGISQAQFARLELGRQNCSPEILRKIQAMK